MLCSMSWKFSKAKVLRSFRHTLYFEEGRTTTQYSHSSNYFFWRLLALLAAIFSQFIVSEQSGQFVTQQQCCVYNLTQLMSACRCGGRNSWKVKIYQWVQLTVAVDCYCRVFLLHNKWKFIHIYTISTQRDREREKKVFTFIPQRLLPVILEVLESLHLVLKWVEVGCETVVLEFPLNWWVLLPISL